MAENGRNVRVFRGYNLYKWSYSIPLTAGRGPTLYVITSFPGPKKISSNITEHVAFVSCQWKVPSKQGSKIKNWKLNLFDSSWDGKSHTNHHLHTSYVYHENIHKLDEGKHPTHGLLVGGFNPSEQYQSNWIISPKRDEHKKYLKPPPRLWLGYKSPRCLIHELQVYIYIHISTQKWWVHKTADSSAVGPPTQTCMVA